MNLMKTFVYLPCLPSYQVKNILSTEKISLQCLGHGAQILMTKDASLFFHRLTDLIELNLTGIHMESQAVNGIASALD